MALTKVKTGVVDDSVFAANKNVIINGNFNIWQRGTSFTAVASGDYTADRSQWAQSGTGVVDILRSTSVPDNLSDFSLQVDVTTADASIAAGDLYNINYRAEGYDVMRFGFGTADATQLTLSFWCRSGKDGVHCVAFRNSAGDRSFIAEYTITVADTWEFFTITLTADTTGTWLTNNGKGLEIKFALAIGSTFHTAAGSWTAGNFISSSNQVNVLDSAANNFHLSRVQLEVGSVATEFERRSFQQELAMAMRYYTRLGYGMVGMVRSSTNVLVSAQALQEMRASPSATLLTTTPAFLIAATGVTGTSSTVSAARSVRGLWANITGFSGLSTGDPAVYNANTDLIALDAEL